MRSDVLCSAAWKRSSCFAWNRLIDMPWKIMSIGVREWAYRS
jgi:hypothetical protein